VPTELVLVRHGDAHAGLHGVIAGQKACRGLTDTGREQAALLRDHLEETGRLTADVMVASEIPRAIETAEIVAPSLGARRIANDCDLCEVHTGEADGMEWTEHARVFGHFDMMAEPDRVFAPGGDSWNSFHDRVHRALNRLSSDHPDQTVVAFCHAGVITAAMGILLERHRIEARARLHPTNTGLTGWDHDATIDQWTLRYYNDARHLDV